MSLKSLCSRHKWLLVAYVIAASTRTRIRYKLGKIDSFSGSTTSTLSVEQSLGYANLVYDDFVAYGKLGPAEVRGKRFLELGPGDNVGVGLRFLADGAAQYACLDKFYSTHDLEHERQIYLALRGQLNEEQRRNFDAAVKLEPALEFNREKIYYAYGLGAQDADRVGEPGSFDFIISRGVLQEVYEIDRAFAAMDKLLKPGGKLIHKIDLRDYGTFSSAGFHPREFLTIPKPVYFLMAYDSDKSNRRMLDYYRRKVRELGYDAELYITCTVERGYQGIQQEIRPHKLKLEYGVDYFDRHREMIREVRPRLAAEFRNMSDEELLAGAVFLVAKKP